MTSPVRLASQEQEQPAGKAPLPQAEIIPYPGTHPAAAEVKKGIDLSPLLGGLRNAALAVLPTLLMVAALLMVWEMACSGEGSSLPAPSKVWTDSKEVILHPLKGVEMDGIGFKIQDGGDVGIAGHVLTSLKRVALGFTLSAIFGIALGILIGQSQFAYRALDPLFQILRTVPPLAWLPLSLAIFQQAQPSAIFLIFITAIWPVILNTAAGVQNIPMTYRNVAKVLSLNPFEYFTKVMLPATVPHMFTGLRIGIGMSWLAIVAAEMVQGGTGIGFFIWDSYNSSLLTDTIVALVWIGIIGFALDRIVGWIGRRIARQA
ncbi:nitrate ABC transporter permease [Rhizorhabdus dicambivorans]|uniref:Nitrate ABC transporter, permease protein n=1 Tax=Rhizorhabdus dicambivorans TaxID=1850238 RepID=A0A2A4FRJ7_9SPHN|nr:nitrate ABC transporter permease [Rhizorhabdus dicambivorans]ATE64618.1 nitrate ABC transporter, permease protein [Rhizorhabdus dicambivorans]PCE40739.1 nitrate ABC transporter, permease protein [Rhizorhabdus dicambivorans]